MQKRFCQKIREELGLSRRELAAKLNVDKTVIITYETTTNINNIAIMPLAVFISIRLLTGKLAISKEEAQQILNEIKEIKLMAKEKKEKRIEKAKQKESGENPS